MSGSIELQETAGPKPGERVVDEKNNESWAARRPTTGGSVRFEPRTGTAGSPEQLDVGSAEESVPADIVFIVKQDGTILYLNRAGPGSSDSSVQGTSVFEYTEASHHAALQAALASAFSDADIAAYECSGAQPFTEGAWYQCRVAPNIREGKVVSATIIARDITDWKQREEELQNRNVELESQLERVAGDLQSLTNTLAERECRQHELDRFRRIMDQAGEAIFITDPDTGRFVDANETACQWLGFNRDKLLTMGVGDLDLEFPLQSPNGVFDHVTDTRTTDRPQVYGDGTHRRRNGTYFPVEVALARRKFGDREYMLVVAREIKERHRTERALRESEVKYRSLFELSRDAIYLSARDGSVADVNDAAMDLFGYSRPEFVGLEARKLYVRSRDIKTFQSGVGEAGAVRDLEVELKKKGGETFKALLTVTLRHDGDGNILGYQCIIRPEGTNGKTDIEDGVSIPELESDESAPGVLVVDGDKRLLTETRTVLERASIPVVTARTLAAGIELLRSQQTDIDSVLLGLDPKGPDPIDAITELRSVDAQIHVVIMGEEAELGTLRDSVVAARAEVMAKPIHPLALIQNVRDALAARRG
jgi:PAS domain S-box-containing protein